MVMQQLLTVHFTSYKKSIDELSFKCNHKKDKFITKPDMLKYYPYKVLA